MKVRDKFDGCDPLIKTAILNSQEILCSAESVNQMIIDGHSSRGPINTWINDFRMSEYNVRFYYDCNNIAYKNAKPL